MNTNGARKKFRNSTRCHGSLADGCFLLLLLEIALLLCCSLVAMAFDHHLA